MPPYKAYIFMQFFIKVVFSLCTSLLLLYTSWMRKGKERLKMSDS